MNHQVAAAKANSHITDSAILRSQSEAFVGKHSSFSQKRATLQIPLEHPCKIRWKFSENPNSWLLFLQTALPIMHSYALQPRRRHLYNDCTEYTPCERERVRKRFEITTIQLLLLLLIIIIIIMGCWHSVVSIVTVRRSNTFDGEIFHALPERPRGSTHLF